MARIFFWTWDEPGHINPVLELALRLRQRGHTPGFIATEKVASLVRSHDFPVIDPPFDPYTGPRGACRDMREVVAAVRGLDADLILCDAIRTFEIAVAMAADAPCAVYSTSLPFWSDPIGPPIDTVIPEPRTVFGRLRIDAAWKRNALRQGFHRWKWIAKCSAYREANHFLFETWAGKGFNRSDIGWNSATKVPLPHYRNVPTLILCPQALDFPRGDSGRLIWTDACILSERPGFTVPRELDTDRGDTEKPLIFVSLGTQVHRVPWARAWFETVCATLREETAWRALLVVGDALAEKLQPLAISGRLTIVDRAAQHLILPKTTVAVIHGGINSVKECIMAGVPMAVFPTGHDQPGNAIRIQSKGLGLMGRGRGLSVKQLAALIKRLMENRFKENVLRMQNEFLSAQRENPAVDAINALIQ